MITLCPFTDIISYNFGHFRWCNGLFKMSDLETDSNSDSKPNGYIALCRSFHIARSQIQIPIIIGSESGSDSESGSVNVNKP